jgi:hypothetical protein
MGKTCRFRVALGPFSSMLSGEIPRVDLLSNVLYVLAIIYYCNPRPWILSVFSFFFFHLLRSSSFEATLLHGLRLLSGAPCTLYVQSAYDMKLFGDPVTSHRLGSVSCR